MLDKRICSTGIQVAQCVVRLDELLFSLIPVYRPQSVD